MRTARRLLRRIRSLWRTRRDEARLQAEIEEHLAMQTADNIRSGMSPVEARRQAFLKFGGVAPITESYREQKGLPSLEALIQDARYGLRRLRMAPAFTITTNLTLALGIGATTSIFTLVHAVLLKSLPVQNPAELYRVGKEARCCYLGGYSQDKEFSLVSYELYRYLRDHAQGFRELAAFPAGEPLFGVRRAGNGEAAQSYPGEFVSGNYFTTFGIRAYAGRMLANEDDKPGARPTAVMSYRLWQERYAGDPSVIGGVFNLNDKPITVVGIAPPGFFGDALRPNPPDFYLPLNTEPVVQADTDLDKPVHWLELIGRIRPGSRPESVEAEMRVALKQWLLSHWGDMSPDERAKFPVQTLYLSPGGAGTTGMREHYAQWLRILMAITVSVLLIVCASVANLMLVRGMERRRQTSLSMALGAGVSRIVRQPVLESILLSCGGGAAGLAVAFAGARLILRFAFPSLPGLAGVPIDASPSIPVLLFAFVTSLATGLLFGIAPAWMATRVDPIEALRGTGRSTHRTGSLPRKALVIFQAAISLVLLTASGLLTSALHRLETQDFGFEQERRTVASFNARFAGYQTTQLPVLYQRLHDSIATIPGVSSVALCLYAPQKGGGWGAEIQVDGRPDEGSPDERYAGWDRVSAGYFETTGNPIFRGRGITQEDTAATRGVAVINQAFARKFFPNQDPIGRRFRSTAGASREIVEVVGIAKDARYLPVNLDRPVAPFFFLPEAQADYSQRRLGSLFMNDIVVVTTPGATVTNDRLRHAVATVDPNLTVISIRALKDQVEGVFTQQRLIARLSSFFGILSLVLASIAVYGVTAYNAGLRTTEIGVRMALGATRGQVLRLVLGGAGVLIAIGLAIGLPISWATARLLESQLYGMNPYSPVVTVGAVLALGLPALVASFVPALRASSILPVDALRSE